MILRGNFIVLTTALRKLKKYHTCNLTSFHKAFLKKEEKANSSDSSRWQETIKLRSEMNEIESNTKIQRINETKISLLGK